MPRAAAAAILIILGCVSVLYCVIRRVYFEMFHRPRIDAIARDLSEWFDGAGGGDAGADDEDAVAKRDRIVKLRDALGVGIDSLPTVRFTAGSRRRRRRGGVDDDHDDAAAAAAAAAAHERKTECLTYGAYVSPVDEYVDCRSYCNVADGVEYRYYDRLGVFLNGRRGRTGGYCVPTDASVCNTNTSLTVYSRGEAGWRCIPQTRAFAGEGGNRIVVCNGRILDRASGKVWHGHIDSTLAFDSIDETLPGATAADGAPALAEYRFVCPPGLRDERGNLYASAPFDRLFLLRNTCAKLIPHADDAIRPVFDENGNGSCECGERARYDERLQTCVPNGGGGAARDDDPFDERTLHSRLDGVATAACWEPWMTVSQARGLLADKLCGVEHENAGFGVANVGYIRYYGAIFDRAVPSPAAMQSAAAATNGG